MIAELVAAQEAVVLEANAIGAAGGSATENISLHRVTMGDNGNGSQYQADVVIQAVVTVTQPSADKPAKSGDSK